MSIQDPVSYSDSQSSSVDHGPPYRNRIGRHLLDSSALRLDKSINSDFFNDPKTKQKPHEHHPPPHQAPARKHKGPEQQLGAHNILPHDINHPQRYHLVDSNSVTNKKDTTSSQEKKDEHSELSNLNDESALRFIRLQNKQSTHPPAKSLLAQFLTMRANANKREISIFFFQSDKRLRFSHSELKDFFKAPLHKITLYEAIPFFLSEYCCQFMNFQPQLLSINPQSFQLRVAQSERRSADLNVDPYDLAITLDLLELVPNLILTRVQLQPSLLATRQHYNQTAVSSLSFHNPIGYNTSNGSININTPNNVPSVNFGPPSPSNAIVSPNIQPVSTGLTIFAPNDQNRKNTWSYLTFGRSVNSTNIVRTQVTEVSLKNIYLQPKEEELLTVNLVQNQIEKCTQTSQSLINDKGQVTILLLISIGEAELFNRYTYINIHPQATLHDLKANIWREINLEESLNHLWKDLKLTQNTAMAPNVHSKSIRVTELMTYDSFTKIDDTVLKVIDLPSPIIELIITRTEQPLLNEHIANETLCPGSLAPSQYLSDRFLIEQNIEELKQLGMRPSWGYEPDCEQSQLRDGNYYDKQLEMNPSKPELYLQEQINSSFLFGRLYISIGLNMVHFWRDGGIPTILSLLISPLFGNLFQKSHQDRTTSSDNPEQMISNGFHNSDILSLFFSLVLKNSLSLLLYDIVTACLYPFYSILAALLTKIKLKIVRHLTSPSIRIVEESFTYRDQQGRLHLVSESLPLSAKLLSPDLLMPNLSIYGLIRVFTIDENSLLLAWVNYRVNQIHQGLDQSHLIWKRLKFQNTDSLTRVKKHILALCRKLGVQPLTR